MFERFTDRARGLMALANAEAHRLNHEFIGPEHILFALLSEGRGTGATALRNAGADPRSLRAELAKAVKPGPSPASPGKLPYAEGAKKVIEYAIQEARELGHNYVGTEHIFLGLLRVGGIVGEVLGRAALTPERGRAAVLDLLGPGPRRTAEPPPGTPASPDDALARIYERLKSISDDLSLLTSELFRLMDERRKER